MRAAYLFLLAGLVENVRGLCQFSLVGGWGCRQSCKLIGYKGGRCTFGKKCECEAKISKRDTFGSVIEKFSDQNPDFLTLEKTFSNLIEHHKLSSENQTNSDGKYRPVSLLLGVLYRMQESKDSNFLQDAGIPVKDGRKLFLTEFLSSHWNLLQGVGKQVRKGISGAPYEEVPNILETNRRAIANKMNQSQQAEVVQIWVSELNISPNETNSNSSESVSSHVPDHAIIVDHLQQAVHLLVFGTRVFPTPEPLDILMDLAGYTIPFLHGEAHAGLVYGTRGLIKSALPAIIQKLEENPGFHLVILGYSLGAGVSQLLAMELELGPSKDMLPVNTTVLTVAFGPPPVFTSRQNIPALSNVLLVQNSEDLISGVSLRTFSDLLAKIRAVDELNIRRRVLVKMALTNGSNSSEGAVFGTLQRFLFSKKEEATARFNAEKAIKDIPSGYYPYLHHIGNTYLVMTRPTSNQITITQFSGLSQTNHFSSQLNLQPSMFNDHMPWAYNHLFSGFGLTKKDYELSLKKIQKFLDENNYGGISQRNLLTEIKGLSVSYHQAYNEKPEPDRLGDFLRELIFQQKKIQRPELDLSQPSLFNITTSRVRSFSISSQRGLLGAWFMEPAESETDSTSACKTVLYLHGVKGTRGRSYRVGLYNLLLKLGFSVLTLDYRGFGDSTDTSESELTVVQDARRSLDWLRSQTRGNCSLYVWAHSMGTGVALHALAEDLQDRQYWGDEPGVKGLILESPYNNFTDMFNVKKEAMNWFSSTALFALTGGAETSDFLSKYNMLFDSDKWITKVPYPTMIIHAEDDRKIPINLAHKLYQAARKAGKKNIWFETFPRSLGLGHHDIYKTKQLPLLIEDFLNKI